MLQKQSSVESQWLDSTIVYLFLIPHVQCKLVGASLPQSLGTQTDRGSIILSLYSQEHMTFFVRGTDSWRVPCWLCYIQTWKWHTPFLFIVHWPALVTWLPNCKRAGKYGKSTGMLGEFHYFCHTLLAIVDSMGVMEMPTWDLETESSRKWWYPVGLEGMLNRRLQGIEGNKDI